MPDNLTTKQRSYCMSRVKNKNTDIEVALRTALYHRGLRYRKHVTTLPGSPDVVFTGPKIAVFVDGDFWHGYQFQRLRKKLSPFWIAKISKNRARDVSSSLRLRKMGWKVVRVWQHSVEQDLDDVIERIEKIVHGER